MFYSYPWEMCPFLNRKEEEYMGKGQRGRSEKRREGKLHVGCEINK